MTAQLELFAPVDGTVGEILIPQAVLQRAKNKYDLFDATDSSDYAYKLGHMLKGMGRLRLQIEAALEYTPGTHTFDQIVAMCVGGHLTFWDLDDSFMLTEIHAYPNARHFHIFLAGGNLDTLVNMHRDVVNVAKALQCDKLTLSGRPGWERALKAHGWNPYLVTLAKDI